MNKFDANSLIDERQKHRGSFELVAIVAQGLKRLSYEFGKSHLHSVEREAIDNICTKIARIVCRESADDIDSWQDIAGYATLVVNLIKEKESNNEAE